MSSDINPAWFNGMNAQQVYDCMKQGAKLSSSLSWGTFGRMKGRKGLLQFPGGEVIPVQQSAIDALVRQARIVAVRKWSGGKIDYEPATP